MKNTSFSKTANAYLSSLQGCFDENIFEAVERLASDLSEAWVQGKNVYICGNGGSAANALHITNDFHYGIGACGTGDKVPGLRIEALTSNTGVITCLANDTGYENIFSNQLEVKANKDDLLIVLSGSGNSGNVINAIKTAKILGLKSYAILAFNGGLCKELVDIPIHFSIEDMQVAEDTQLIVGHICMQWLSNNKPKN